MALQDQLQKLYELSILDRKIDEIRAKVADAPRRKEQLQKTLKEMEDRLAVKNERIGVLEKEKREIEMELQVSRERLDEFQKKINQIKTNREYQAANKEIADSKQAQKVMEDKTLQLMGEMESMMGQVKEEEALWATERAGAESEFKTLEEQEKLVAEETRVFDERHRELRGSLEASLTTRYDRIKTSRSYAVALLVNGTCQGCHVKVPPQLLIETQKFQVMHTCPSCQRILFVSGGGS